MKRILFAMFFFPSVLGWAAPPPHILFILADDLRPDGLHALGNAVVRTPHLDRVVENGFVFRHAYTLGSNSGAVCMPSRTMIQTGISYLRARGNTPTLAQTIKAAGYASIHSGKFSNNPNALDVDFDQHVDGKTAEGNANNIIAFIKKHAGTKPLFLYFAPHEPHDPQYAPDSYYPMYKPADIPLPPNFLPLHPFDNGEMNVRDEKTLPWPRTRENVTGKLARYYASISYLDDQAGRILEALQQAGLFDNTLIIVAGDNGLSLGEHGLLGKQNLYEFGGMHVPRCSPVQTSRKGRPMRLRISWTSIRPSASSSAFPCPRGLTEGAFCRFSPAKPTGSAIMLSPPTKMSSGRFAINAGS